MPRAKNPLLSKTERLLSNLMDMAIKQSSPVAKNPSDRGAADEQPIASDPNRMTVSEMRSVLQTSISWLQAKVKLEPEEEEGPSEFEGLMNDLHRGAPRPRRRDRPASGDVAPEVNGAATDAAGVAREH